MAATVLMQTNGLPASPIEASEEPLRILVIINLAWDPRLGASRVWIELTEQWRAAGHMIERFTFSEAFPGQPAARSRFAFQQLRFPRMAAAYIRKHGHRFDVIDALVGTLPFTKEELGFSGLLVARSVGLYRLYEDFERMAEARWPEPRAGRLAGRLLYRFMRRQTFRLSEESVFKADLINVPNEEEASCLREEVRTPRPVLVQPYGLTKERGRAFAEAAKPSALRLREQRVCFVGMWSARKGARDWAEIVRSVRHALPGVKFRFLGTMVSAERIQADLSGAIDGCEFIPDYQPEELPKWLGDCTVGAFPSYVEGFGLAVLEQLAAGVPTVAYDTAGPRDMLQEDFRDLLVSIADAAGFAAALISVLRLLPDQYDALAERSSARAAKFSWQKIAGETIQAYRAALQPSQRPIVFVQPFSIGSAGGGSRILRALLQGARRPWRSVSSLPRKPQPVENEIHLRARPFWGQIEHSRLAKIPAATNLLFVRRFRSQLKRYCRAQRACAIHAVAHAGFDFAEAQRVARELAIPFLLTVHDDLAYTALSRATVPKLEAAMRAAWEGAAARFVISEALGQEYCRRYGDREFHIVTDGLTQLEPLRHTKITGRLRIYFMGLFHVGYEKNLRALLDGICILERERPEMSVTVTLRCEHVRSQILAGTKEVTLLPFAEEAQVQRDLLEADLLYLPLPFGDEHVNFARYSLSTKMVTYLGSGLPILYHGPPASAAFELLSKHGAAIPLTSLAAAEIAETLGNLSPEQCEKTAANALVLAQREFMLVQQHEKFWATISRSLATA